MRILPITEKEVVKKILIKFREEDLIEILKEIPEVRDEMDKNYDADISFYIIHSTDKGQEKVYVGGGSPLTMEIPLPEK